MFLVLKPFFSISAVSLQIRCKLVVYRETMKKFSESNNFFWIKLRFQWYCNVNLELPSLNGDWRVNCNYTYSPCKCTFFFKDILSDAGIKKYCLCRFWYSKEHMYTLSLRAVLLTDTGIVHMYNQSAVHRTNIFY